MEGKHNSRFNNVSSLHYGPSGSSHGTVAMSIIRWRAGTKSQSNKVDCTYEQMIGTATTTGTISTCIAYGWPSPAHVHLLPSTLRHPDLMMQHRNTADVGSRTFHDGEHHRAGAHDGIVGA